MQPIASGKVLHAGTLNGNPLCLAAAFATIEVLAANDGALYGPLRSRADRLRTAIAEALRKAGFSVITSGDGPVFHVSFMDQSASNYRDTLRARSGLYEDFALALLNRGVLVLPDGRWYVSAAHTEDDIDHTIEAVQSICG
jgi:glutamate-1-semialdehyde 2,1-aminomutase